MSVDIDFCLKQSVMYFLHSEFIHYKIYYVNVDL